MLGIVEKNQFVRDETDSRKQLENKKQEHAVKGLGGGGQASV